MTEVKAAFQNQFTHVTEIGDCVIRGERRYHDKAYTVAYVDYSDDIVNRAGDLRAFQERLLGANYFSAPDELRWNNYFFLIAGPKSRQSIKFEDAKAQIEANRDYARKLVLSEEESLEFFSESKLFLHENDIETADITGVWRKLLTSHQLGVLFEKLAPRTKTLDMIAEGKASGAAPTAKTRTLTSSDALLASAYLRTLELTRSRGVHDAKKFNFGDVNLIVGPNGSGKTTLLEGIEFLYCGWNRREKKQGDFTLKATFQHGDSQPFSLTSTKDTARIKARSLAWYRNEDHHAIGILDGFTRYNFLDTDAAFRFTTELDPVNLKDDLNRLIVGPEASTLWSYLQKITVDLDARVREFTDLAKAEESRCELLRKDVERLKSAPSQATALAKTYHSALQRLGWRSLSKGVDHPVDTDERASLELASKAITDIQTQSDLKGVTATSIRNRYASILQNSTEAIPFDTIRSQTTTSMAEVQLAFEQADQKLKDLVEWSGYCEADVPTHMNRLEKAGLEVTKVRKLLGPLASTAKVELPDEYSHLGVQAAINRATRVASDAKNERTSMEAALLALKETEKSLSFVALQLQDAARQLLANSKDPSTCPVCGTSHDPSALHAKIESLVVKATGTQSPVLMKSLQRETAKEAEAQRTLKELAVLQTLCERLKLDLGETAVQVAKEQLQALHSHLQFALTTQSVSGEAMRNLDLIGLSVGRYTAIRAQVSQFLGGEDDIESTVVISKAREDQMARKESLASKKMALQKRLAEATATLTSYAISFQKTGAITPVQKILHEIQVELQRAKTCRDSLEILEGLIKFPPDRLITELQFEVEACLAQHDRALHAVQSDHAAGISVSSQQKDYERISKSLADKKERLRRLKEAQGVLKKLRKEHSLDLATQQVLESIRNQVNDVFSRIHSPREFEFADSSNHLLATRDTHMPRSLEQISTGQRAAFALSIFLALNSTARNAPPILLIDDPIAHVDDLNALSFLDYLRDIALHSKRQIFFATADTRFASLFEKKFEFLGNKRYVRITLPRRSAT